MGYKCTPQTQLINSDNQSDSLHRENGYRGQRGDFALCYAKGDVVRATLPCYSSRQARSKLRGKYPSTAL